MLTDYVRQRLCVGTVDGRRRRDRNDTAREIKDARDKFFQFAIHLQSRRYDHKTQGKVDCFSNSELRLLTFNHFAQIAVQYVLGTTKKKV